MKAFVEMQEYGCAFCPNKDKHTPFTIKTCQVPPVCSEPTCPVCRIKRGRPAYTVLIKGVHPIFGKGVWL